MVPDAWSDLVRGFDGIDPPLDLRQRVEQREARLRPTAAPRWHLPRAAGWALAAGGAAAVAVALALAAHSRRSEPHGGWRAPATELAAVRASFAPQPGYSRLPLSSVTGGVAGQPMPTPRPSSALASDRTLDSAWQDKNRDLVLIWTSGVVETIRAWHEGSAADAFSRFPADFDRLMIGGDLAVAHASNPRAGALLGYATRAEIRYGTPASVELLRGGFAVTLYQYGGDTLPGLLAAARTLPPGDMAPTVINDGHTVIKGGTEGQRALLRSIMRGIDSRLVPEVRVGFGSGAEVTFIIKDGETTRNLATWQAWLAAGAFRELSRIHGLPEVSGYNVNEPSLPIPFGHSFLPRNADHATSNVGAETLTLSIERNLATAHLALVSLRFAKPFNLAPIVIARTDDPRAESTGWTPKLNPIGNDGLLEGGFFEVIDASGKVVFFVAHSTRTQTGMSNAGDLNSR